MPKLTSALRPTSKVIREGDVIRWKSADCGTLAAPNKAITVLKRAIEAAPAQAIPRLKLANLHLDRYEFAAAIPLFEAALRIDPTLADARLHLARCYNVVHRHDDALASLAASAESVALFERGVALAALDRGEEAEVEFRAVLAADPHHRRACMKLCGVLRSSGRVAELLSLCEDLARRGVDHAQLLLDWGRALALNGNLEDARRILFDPKRIAQIALPVPAGFESVDAFNTALAEELLTNPFSISGFPVEEEANRGSTRVEALFDGARPELIRALLNSLQAIVDDHAVAASGVFDPWPRARPTVAHLHPWGLIQRGGDHEAWHTHRGGWMSGVYYVRVPKSVSADGDGHGCIEFGPPRSLAQSMPDFLATWRHAPREGTMLLAPSHYHHRTIPTGLDEYRISFAFDVVPDA